MEKPPNEVAPDATLEWMIKNNIPLTRNNYINLNWLGDPPEEWDAELEMSLPEIFQLDPVVDNSILDE
jgi:hypothetical protein